MMRVIGWFLTGATLFVAAAILAAFFAIGNPAASAWIIKQATGFVPGTLVIREIDGDLVSGIRLGSLHYELPAVHLTVNNAEIHIRWLELIERRLVFQRLVAAELTVDLIEDDTPPAEDDVLPEIRTPIGIHLEQLTFGRFSLRAAGVDESLTELAARIQLVDTQLDVISFSASRDNLDLSLSGKLDFIDQYPLTTQANWHIIDSPLSGSGKFSGDLRALDFEHVLQVPGTVSISGQLAGLTRKPRIDATANWANITWAPDQGDAITARGGQARLIGTVEQFTAQLRGDVSLPSLPELMLDIEASGDLDKLEITRLDVAGLGGSLKGSGRVSLGEQRVTLNVSGKDLDPGTIRTDLPGRLDAIAAVDLQLPDRFDIDIQSVQGEFLGQALSGKARVSSAEQQWSIVDMQINVADNEFRFDGTLLPNLSGRFRIDADDLAAVWPGLRGQIEGEGTFEGTLAEPVGQIELQARQLFYRDQGAENLEIEGNIDSSQRVQLTVGAKGLSSGGTSLGDLDARVSGTLDAHQVNIELAGGVAGISIDADGGWDGQSARYAVNSGNIDTGPGGQWLLANPFNFQATASNLQFDAHCWTQNTARLCAQSGELSDATTRVAGTLDQFPLAAVQQWLGDDFSVAGTANAEFALLREENNPLEGRFNWRQRATRIDYRDSPKSSISMTIDTVQLDVIASAEGADITGKLRTDFGITADLDARVAPPVDDNASIDGRLQMTVADIAESAPLMDRFINIDRARGRIDADLEVTGTVGSPRVQGRAQLTDGSVYIPQAGIEIEDIELLLSGRNGSPVDVTGSARSGAGELRVTGKLDYSEKTGAFAELSIDGENFQVLRLPNQTADISPELTARIDSRELNVAGNVLIPRAEILIETLPASAATPSADAVVETATPQPPTRRAPIEVIGELDVALGDNVRFAGFGIDTRLAGGLQISRSAGAVSPVTEGNLRTVEGRFTAYRKTLTIERGTLIFVGSLTDPNLDVRAVRNLTYEGQAITVGVLLTGRLSDMQTRIFSEPAMGEADALSYLVLNRPLRKADDSDSVDLSSAALALGISQAMPVTQQLGESLGLDEVSIEGTSEETTSVVAGRRLGEDLYIRYSYGLFNRIGTFIVRYDLRGGISVEAGSGEEQTLDLIFTIRR